MFNLNNIIGALAGAALAAAALVLFYEGVPVGPLTRIPGIGPLIADITDGRVDRERKAALQGYVLESRAVAAESRLIEVQRQLEAGRRATEGFAVLLAEAQKELADSETNIAAFENRHPDRERLNAADIDFLRYRATP